MDRSREDGDLEDLRQKTARAHEKLLCLLLDVAPRVKNQELRSERESLTQTSHPAIREWTENRLADFNLWITGVNFLARPEVFSSLGPIKSVIASLLTLLGSLLDVCRTSVVRDMQILDDENNSGDDADDADRDSDSDVDASYLSPWSNGSSGGSGSESGVNPSRGDQKNPQAAADAKKLIANPETNKTTISALPESMREAESALGQLVRLGFEIRQSATTERTRIVDATSIPKRKSRALRFGKNLPLLACPYAKFDPLKHDKCHTFVLKGIPRVKQHLDRVHSIPVHCPKCYAVFRNNPEVRDKHVKEGTCQTVSERYLEGIDEATIRQLKRRTTSKSVQESWYSIFALLFPGAKKPESPFSIVTSLTSANIQSWNQQHHSQVEDFTRQNAKEQANIRQELIEKLLASNGKSSMGTYQDGRIQNHLSKVQIRLIDSALRRQKYSEYAWNHTKKLGPQTLHTTQASDASRSITVWESSKDAPYSMFQFTPSPVHGRSSTQADLKPSIANISTTSGQLCYPVPLKAVKNGTSVARCPYCAHLFDDSFIRDPQRWRKHIDQDLLPYICPVEDCRVPDMCYGSAEDWRSHLYNDHIKTTCWLCPACSEKLETPREFIVHVEQNHNHIIDLELLDDFAEQCKQSELVLLVCPVCGDRNRCTLDDIGQHIHTFSVSSLTWPVINSPPDELESSQEDESSYSDTEDLIDGETPATSTTGEPHQVNRSAGSVRSQAEEINVTLDDVRQSSSTTTHPVHTHLKYHDQTFDAIEPPSYSYPSRSKRLEYSSKAAEDLQSHRVVPGTSRQKLYTSPSPQFDHHQASMEPPAVDETLMTTSVIEWMSPVDPTEDYEQAVKLRYPGTGLWFLESGSFSRYKTGAIHNICLYGEPGCGKTVLCSTIITHLAMNPNFVTIYFFFDNRDTQKQTGDAMLLSLASQLFRQREECQWPLSVLYGAGKGNKPTGQALEQTLGQMIVLSAVQVHIVLDALDECREQDAVLERVREILSWSYTKIRVIATSRTAFHIKSGTTVGSALLNIQNLATRGDIIKYVVGRLKSAEFSHRFSNQKAYDDMSTKVLKKCDRKSFHYCSLLLDAVGRCIDLIEHDDILKLLPNNTGQMFARALKEALEGPGSSDIIRLLRLLLHADPITLGEATDALAVDSAELLPFAPRNMRQLDPYKTVNNGLGLLKYVNSSQKFMLAHSTVRDYLLSDEVDDLVKAGLQGDIAKLLIVKTCLGYLALLPVDIDRGELIRTYPFADYAAREWIKQAREAAWTHGRFIDQVRRVFVQSEIKILRWILPPIHASGFVPDEILLQPTTRLYLAAYAGLVVGAKALLDNGVNPYARLDRTLPADFAYHVAIRQRGTDIENLFRSYRKDTTKSNPVNSELVEESGSEPRDRYAWIQSLKASRHQSGNEDQDEGKYSESDWSNRSDEDHDEDIM